METSLPEVDEEYGDLVREETPTTKKKKVVVKKKKVIVKKKKQQEQDADQQDKKPVVKAKKKVIKVKKPSPNEGEGQIKPVEQKQADDDQDSGTKKKKKKVVVKKVIVKKKKKAATDKNASEENEDATQTTKPKKKVIKRKAIAQPREQDKEEKQKDNAESKDEDQCEDREEDEEESGGGEDFEGMGFASRNYIEGNISDQDEMEDKHWGEGKRDERSDDEDYEALSPDTPENHRQKTPMMTKVKAGSNKKRGNVEDDLIEQDLDPMDPDEDARNNNNGKHLESKDDDEDDDEEGQDWDPETLSQRYVDEFSAVQNQEREMSDRILSLRKLLYNPVPKDVTLKCQIDRHYDNAGSVYYSFILPVERKDGLRDKRMTLMIAKSRSGMHLKPTYVISLEPIDFRKKCNSRSERYFGKLQVVSGLDAWGLTGPIQYVLYDDGYNPSKVSSRSPPVGYERKELASIVYANSKKAPEDLRMSIGLPISRLGQKDDQKNDVPRPSSEEKDLASSLVHNHYYSVTERLCQDVDDTKDHPFLSAAEAGIVQVRSIPVGNKKRPAMSDESRFPVAPSVKNFEVARHPVNAHSTPDMGLVRIGKERFFIAVRYPFSPFEAFGIALSKFDSTGMYRSKLSRKFSSS